MLPAGFKGFIYLYMSGDISYQMTTSVAASKRHEKTHQTVYYLMFKKTDIVIQNISLELHGVQLFRE